MRTPNDFIENVRSFILFIEHWMRVFVNSGKGSVPEHMSWKVNRYLYPGEWRGIVDITILGIHVQYRLSTTDGEHPVPIIDKLRDPLKLPAASGVGEPAHPTEHDLVESAFIPKVGEPPPQGQTPAEAYPLICDSEEDGIGIILHGGKAMWVVDLTSGVAVLGDILKQLDHYL